MELHQMRYVCAIAESGSFSRAATRCHVAQPSLSQQISKLEGELGARLFHRLGRSIQLTQAGRVFLPHARTILQETERARHEVQGQQSEARGAISLGVIPTVAPYFVPALAAAFIQRNPHAALRIQEDITPLLVEGLHNRSVDIALLSLPLKNKELEWRVLASEPLYVALPRKHRQARAQSVSLRDLRDDPFLLLRDGHCFRNVALSVCRRARVQPQILFESGQFISLLGMVAAGMGVAIVPRMAIDRHAACAYVQLSDPQAERTIVAAWLHDRHLSRAQQLFLQHLEQAPALTAATRARPARSASAKPQRL